MNITVKQLELSGIIPVVVIDDKDFAEPLAEALLEGGVPCAEITFRTEAACDVISKIAGKYPSMLVGAGTVLTVDQVKRAVQAGARFIVSPGIKQDVVEYCLREQIPVTPGVVTPTEVMTAVDLGLEVVKYFPAEAAGGLAFLRAMSAPFKNVKFIPTGGIDETNILSYLKFPQVLACGGSWMVSQKLISEHRFDEIRRLTAQAVSTVLGFELRHIGINTPDRVSADALSERISGLFRLPVKDGTGSVFVGTQFEVLKRMYRGSNGHLAVGTNFIDRALDYFKRQGVRICEETRNEKDGKLSTVYLDLDIGGFALHLVQL